MGYLLLAILCSSLISIFMKLSEKHLKSDAGMFIFNYAACMVLGVLYLPKKGSALSGTAAHNGLAAAITVGLIAGVFLLLTFAVFKKNIGRNGMVLSSIFMKLSVIVSVLISIIFFREKPTFVQVIGFVLALAAIVIFNFEKGALSQPGAVGFLLILPLVSGLADSTVNIYDKIGTEAYGDLFLLLTFVSAFICALVLFFRKREKIGRMEVLFGVLIGVPNYYTSRFLLLSLNSIPAVVVYPIYSVATIIVISLAGILVFKEKLTRQKFLALLLVLASVVLLQL